MEEPTSEARGLKGLNSSSFMVSLKSSSLIKDCSEDFEIISANKYVVAERFRRIMYWNEFTQPIYQAW